MSNLGSHGLSFVTHAKSVRAAITTTLEAATEEALVVVPLMGAPVGVAEVVVEVDLGVAGLAVAMGL